MPYPKSSTRLSFVACGAIRPYHSLQATARDDILCAVEADDLPLLFELFEHTPRQAPGSVETTRRALRLLPGTLRIERVLDLGYGTGGSTIVLAEETSAHVTAVDIHPTFLASLRARADERHLVDRITTVVGDMANAQAFGSGFDLIWAEGSAYSIGFENALRLWCPLLRPGGCLVATELVWFVAEAAARARAFFASEYPDMCDEVTRINQARGLGYEMLGSFRLPAKDWHDYYAGLEVPLRDAISRRGEREIYGAIRLERAIYEAFGDDYGYLCLALRSPSRALTIDEPPEHRRSHDAIQRAAVRRRQE